MLIVPLPGTDAPLFARSSRQRNLRVAERVGATVATTDDLGRAAGAAILVPPGVVINAVLFADPAVDAAVRRAAMDPQAGAVWLASSRAAGVLLGPARALQPYAQDLAGAAELPRIDVDADGVL